MHTRLALWALMVVLGHTAAAAQDLSSLDRAPAALVGGGWEGFSDVAFLGQAALALVLATALGAVIAFHPRSRQTVDRLEEAEAQKVYVLYAAIGAIAGIMVLKYGVVVGFVIFGIGGLIRFRTDLRSAPMTGRLIFVTLVGLSSGLDLPHLAVLATAFGFVLIAVLDSNATYRIVVKGLGVGTIVSAAHAYRALLEQAGCRILGERKNLAKEQVALVFRAPHRFERERFEQRLEQEIPEELRRAVDWEVE